MTTAATVKTKVLLKNEVSTKKRIQNVVKPKQKQCQVWPRLTQPFLKCLANKSILVYLLLRSLVWSLV